MEGEPLRSSSSRSRQGGFHVNELQTQVIVTYLMKEMSARGSWCGETHIQKASYFLKELLGVPLRADFILYKHGPFSFDLRHQLTAMRADGMVDVLQHPPYGPSLVCTPYSESLQRSLPELCETYRPHIDFVTEHLADKNVSVLERLATALYVTLRNESATVEERADQLNDLKPHISIETASVAVRDIDVLIHEAATNR